ncbi:MAG: glycoside hydrolase family 97 N-terminal domain-containing protein, partial [Candidatus Saccharibacteria bacterium]|nr:glycoside hydrolase family 97 N-terminal domain-containing protein [Candidatus Saccharibacteria bacterium]
MSAKFILDHGQIAYFVEKDEKPILRKSRLGIMLKDSTPLADGFAVVRAYSRSFDDTWRAQWGEQHVIRNNYNETAIYLEEVEKPSRLLTIRFRAYDDGIAFRYEVPAQPEMERMIISDELTEFSVDTNSRSWSIPAYQPDRYEYDYVEHPVYTLTESVHTPLTIQTPTNQFIAIHE